MTDLQVKYQTLQETKRANQVQEDLKRRETAVKEGDLDSIVSLRTAQEKSEYAKIQKMAYEIDKIQADTSLSKAQKEKAISETVKNYMTAVTGFASSLAGLFLV